MKTIFKNGVYSRVDNEVAESKVKHQGFVYKPKSEWKQNVRDVKISKKEEPIVEESKPTEPKKKFKKGTVQTRKK